MSANEYLPKKRELPALRRAAAGCRGCPLFKRATQTVFGEGPAIARTIFIGEQPGDAEDIAGKPFVGPAGQLLDEVLVEAGIDRQLVYVTNAVKHFKWEPRGKRRLHKKPSARELKACEPWLEAEFEVIEPRSVVCLGATAAQAIISRDFRVSVDRGKFIPTKWSEWTLATWHPSAILRAPDREHRHIMRQEFTTDLRLIADLLT